METNDVRLARSVREWALRLGVSQNFLRGEIQGGRLVARRVGAGRGRVLVLERDVEAWLGSHRDEDREVARG